MSLSAYPAFLSIGNFYDNKFSKDKEKFSEKLGNSDIIFEMSQVKEFVNWMTGKLVNDVINKITRSNLKKIKKTLEWTTTEIKEVTNSFNKLEVKLHSNYKLTSRILDEASETFEMNLENTVYKSLRILKSNTRKKIYSIINNGISDKGFEKELKKIVEKELKNFSIDLNKKIEKQSKDFKDEMSEIVSTYQRYVDELVEHYAKSVKFEFDFQPNIKIKRNINIGNVLMALLGDIIGIISTALNMSNPVGWVILGLSVLSTFFHVYKIVRGAIDKNFQKSQQRKNADENIKITFEGSLANVPADNLEICVLFNNMIDIAFENVKEFCGNGKQIIALKAETRAGFLFCCISFPIENEIKKAQNNVLYHSFAYKTLKNLAEKNGGKIETSLSDDRLAITTGWVINNFS